jgi:hypothetical protein
MDLTLAEIALIISAVGSVATATGSIMAYRQIRMSYRQVKISHRQAVMIYRQINVDQDWNRRKATYDLMFQAYVGTFREWRHEISLIVDVYDTNKKFINTRQKFTQDNILTIDNILNFIENLCLSVKHNIVDEKIIHSSLAGMVIAYYRFLEPHIANRRKDNPLLWVEMDPYVIKWSTWRQERISKAQSEMTLPGSPPLGSTSRLPRPS